MSVVVTDQHKLKSVIIISRHIKWKVNHLYKIPRNKIKMYVTNYARPKAHWFKYARQMWIWEASLQVSAAGVKSVANQPANTETSRDTLLAFGLLRLGLAVGFIS